MRVDNSLKLLFTSTTRQDLLNLFFSNPQELYYPRQLSRLIHQEINSVRRELDNLKKAGLVTSDPRSNKIYYQANTQSDLFPDLVTLVCKNCGLGQRLAKSKNQIGSFKAVLASRSFLYKQPSTTEQIDLIIVGSVILPELEYVLKQEEVSQKREINFMLMTESEFHLRQNRRDPALVDFFLALPTAIIGGLSK